MGSDREQGKEQQAPGTSGERTGRIVFDDPLSRQTSDDTDEGWGERSRRGGDDSLDWYLREKPPHHG